MCLPARITYHHLQYITWRLQPGLIRPYSHCAFLAALNHFWACSLSAYTGKLQLETWSQSVSLRASVQTLLPERPQLLPHRPRPAADVGHDLLLVLDVLEDLLGVMVVSLILADILIWVADGPAHTPREKKQDKLLPSSSPNCWFVQSSIYESYMTAIS